MGITPGTVILLRKLAPLGDPMEVNLRGYELSLRKNEAEQVIIEKIEG
jgi:ferrous iron transport protein A